MDLANNKNRIPSVKEFEAADRETEEEFKGLSHVEAVINETFSSQNIFYKIHIFPGGVSNEFTAIVFYKLNKDLLLAKETDLSQELRTAILLELEKVGRGARNTIKLNFVEDSDENVKEKFGGDYFLRLR
ncbi:MULTISPECIES: hypothetical protein [unclassified Pseudovibrio]|uniref:hypothetical protein n=1 Tax=unclassified Pseudovibrio TaxID=2627060 RepID=UPI0007AE822F|nr:MULTISPECIES: hypothetical protein [unclassified Pseudovibrio]